MSLEMILHFILSLVAFFTAIVFHEYAHGWVAYKLGDPTARYSGRLTLNPLAHVDLIGTVILPIVLAILRLPVFGWAKPVPINPLYFRRPYQGMMFVALAGPLMNIILALAGTALWRLLGTTLHPKLSDSLNGTIMGNGLQALFYLLGIFVIINVILALFNLIPVPPLDGSRVLTYFLPQGGRDFMQRLEPFGFLIIFGLLWLGALDKLIMPLVFWVQTALLS